MRFGISAVLLAACSLNAYPVAAQSVVERTPNVNGAWTGDANTAYFNFMHRFQVSDDATRRASRSAQAR